MSIAEKLTAIAENEQKVYDAGKQAEYDRFWDAYQRRGLNTNYSNRFYNWPAELYRPKYPIYTENYTNSCFSYAQFTDVKVPLIVAGSGSLSACFDNWSAGITIPSLQVTEKTVFANTFRNCTNLETVIFDGVIGKNGLDLHWSTKLSADSIRSLVATLSPDTAGLTVTLSQAAREAAFTDEEWAALIATKPNWTIALL